MSSSEIFLEYHFHCSGEENSLTECTLTSLDSSYCGNALDNTYYNCSGTDEIIKWSIKAKETPYFVVCYIDFYFSKHRVSQGPISPTHIQTLWAIPFTLK